MKIVIAGGRNKADYLIRSLLGKGHRLVVIHDDPEYCNYLAQTHRIPIICGDACKHYVLDEAEIQQFDIMIALRPSDADNLVICQTAKKCYGVKKAVCTVSNPKNVQIFQKLGVNTALSATYMVSELIEQASTIESLVNTLSVEHGKIVLTELLVDTQSPIARKRIMDMEFAPGDMIIGCIVRGSEMIVPQGSTQVLPNDKLVILSKPERQQEIIQSIMGRKN